MIKNLLALLVTVILAAPVRSAVGAPSAASSRAWVSPLAGVFSSVGAERIATMGSPALTALSTLDSNARYPFAADPQVIDLLAKNLRFYVTLETFAAMSTEDKLIMLRAAAKGAEIEAADIADKALGEAKSAPLHPSSADHVSDQIAQVEKISLYLDAARRNETIRLRRGVESFRSKWRKHVEKFHEELPMKIAEGAFDASNILVKTEHGWVAADESPYPVEADLSRFYGRRIAELEKAPQGPWVAQEASLLKGALDRPDIGGSQSWSEPARLKLADIISAVETRVLAPSLVSAARAFERNAQDGRPVAPRHMLAIEKHYEDVAMNPQPPSILFRSMAAMRNGAGGLPSWERLRQAERSAIARLRRRGLIAGGVLASGMIATIPFGTAAWPLAAKLAALSLVWLAPLVVFLRSFWLLQSLEWARDSSFVEGLLRRIFPND